MSDFKVEVVKLGPCGKHPNADVLGITQVFGQNCIFNLNGGWKEGDLAIYVPAESVCPLDRPYFAWLAKKEGQTTHRVKPVRLRGIYSEGFLIRPAEVFGQPTWGSSADPSEEYSPVSPGQDVTGALGVVKYEEPEDFNMATESEKDPRFMPVYDVENYYRFKHLLTDGEEVVVTEKIHGCNGRFAYKDGRLWVGSHGQIKKFNETNLWWKVALKYDLENVLKKQEGLVFYGEVYGVQDLKYGVTPQELAKLRIFDIYDTDTHTWFNHKDLVGACEYLKLDMVPVLYTGPLNRDVVESLRTGVSVVDGKTIREGVVVRPAAERWNYETGRTLFKIVSEDYKLRKGGTERK